LDVKIISGSSLCYLSLLRNEWKDHEDLSVFWKSVELSVVRLYVIFRCWEMSERTTKTFQFSGSQLNYQWFVSMLFFVVEKWVKGPRRPFSFLEVSCLYVIFRCWEMSERTTKTFQFSGSQLSLCYFSLLRNEWKDHEDLSVFWKSVVCYFWLLRNEWEDHEDLSVFWKSVAVLVFLWNCQDLIIFYRSRIKLSRKTKVICVWILNLIIFFSFFSLTRWSLKNQSTFLLSCSRFNKGHYFYPSKMIFGTSWF
jgi:hypothetical protein